MSGRPRLNLGDKPSSPVNVAADPQGPAPTPVISGGEWSRPEPVSAPELVGPVATLAPIGEYRRSGAAKRNRTVSVPADYVVVVRTKANVERWSITDLVFLSVERYRSRLRAAPDVPGREPGPKPVAVTRAHLVLYLADEEWSSWKETATRCGLGTPSRLVAEALAAFDG
jgi:hypothetical protein